MYVLGWIVQGWIEAVDDKTGGVEVRIESVACET